MVRKFLWFIVIIAVFGSIQSKAVEPPPFYARLNVTDGEPRVGEEFTVSFDLKALTDLPEIRVYFDIPEGFEVRGGKIQDTLSPRVGDSLSTELMLCISEPGPYRITAYIIIAPGEPEGILSFAQVQSTNLYILSG